MSSASPWIAINIPGRCHGTATLRTEAAKERRKEMPLTIGHAKAVAEMHRTPSWKAMPVDQGLTTREIQNLDERDDGNEDLVMPWLAPRG
jgi:hypothetical protein